MAMVIKKDNLQDLNRIPVHDLIFNGFWVGYPSRDVQLELADQENHQGFRLTFHDVPAMQWQGCNLWNGGSSVYGMWPDEEVEYFRQMKDRKPDQLSFFEEDDAYFGIVLGLISGDELKIVCRQIEVRLFDYPDDEID